MAGARPNRFEVRIHGRGGQGVVTAAELLSIAAFEEGLHAQAFPSFGSERTGAPVVSFCRFDEVPIRTREPVAEPDALIVQDPTLLHQVDLFSGLGPEGHLLINSGRSFDELGLDEFVGGLRGERALAVPAGEIARRRLGRPLPNAALLGGFAALTGRLRLECVQNAIRERFSGRAGESNSAAAADCFELVTERLGAVSRA
jgi:pyruvate ferredoxin oxidoreductase gamma subunit